jgi:nucleolar protein 14
MVHCYFNLSHFFLSIFFSYAKISNELHSPLAKIVSENFFGGFNESAAGEKVGNDEENKKKSRKEWIDEMIAKSKQLRYEKQKEKDKTLELTENLDKQWKELFPVINKMINKNEKNDSRLHAVDQASSGPKKDDFDSLVRQLQFDSKAKVKSIDI